MKDYKLAVDALTKAYLLGDFEVLVSVKNQIYKDFGNVAADNIDQTAHYARRKIHRITEGD